jgi:hypothetical protein
MGTWGAGSFENDVAVDWTYGLEKSDGLSYVESTLDKAFIDPVDADAGVHVIAAAEVLARLLGNFGTEDGYTQTVDAWVRAHSQSVSPIMVAKAHHALDRVANAKSELHELWDESGDLDGWLEEVAGLRRRLGPGAPDYSPPPVVPKAPTESAVLAIPLNDLPLHVPRDDRPHRKFRVYDKGKRIGVEQWDDEIPGFIAENQTKTVWFNRAAWVDPRGHENDLNELVERIAALNAPVEGVSLNHPVDDPRVLERFSNLRKLYLTQAIDRIDFSALPHLEELTIIADKTGFGNLAAAKALRSLDVLDGGLVDLTPLANLGHIEELTVYEGRLRSIRGIENLPRLRSLNLAQLPLESIEGIGQLRDLETLSLFRLSRLTSIAEIALLPKLRKLDLDGLPKLQDVDTVGACPEIEELGLTLKKFPSAAALSRLHKVKLLKIEESSKVATLSFVRGMPLLERFIMYCTVDDGDLSPLAEAPNLRWIGFGDRRRYRPRRIEVAAAMWKRHGPIQGFEDHATAAEIADILRKQSN